jgi:hypothetical protein
MTGIPLVSSLVSRGFLMLARTRAALGVVGAATMLGFTATSARAQTPTAAQVIDKYITAIGGREAISALKSMHQMGTMEMPAMGLSMEMDVSAAAPNKRAMKMSIPGMGEMVQGFDGTTAWASDPMQGPRVLKDKELATMMESADFTSEMLKDASKFKSIEVVGQEAFEGTPAWKLKFTRPSGNITTEFYAIDTGLLIGQIATQSTPQGEIEARTVLGAYQQFGPIKQPTKINMSAGPQQMSMTTKSITFNDVADSAFALPEAIKALVKP